MGLLNAFKQYVRDAMPGGALNPEVTKQGLLDSAAIGTAPVPILGDAVGLLSDLSRFKDNPAERTPTNIGLSALGVLPFVPSFAGMFVGKGSKTWDAVAAAKAQQLADKGVDPRQIWKETGTFKGPDGAWRQEIDDSAATFIDKFRKPTNQEFDDFFKAQVTIKEVDDLKRAAQQAGDFSIPKFYGDKPGLYDKYRAAKDTVSKYQSQFQNPTTIKKGPLGNFLDHDKLDAAYPQLYDIPTTHNKNHSGGTYFENMNELLIGGGQEKSIALHELQHAIQGREGWARGGSPDDAELMPYVRKFYADNIDKFDGESHQLVSMAKQRAYNNLAGEAEARATQARMNLNAAQRRELFPLDSWDVPLDQLIVRRGLLD